MARRTRTFLITAVAAAATLIPAAGASAGTLDQQQTLSDFGGLQVDSSHSKAQTFTAGLTGQLDQVDLALSGMSVTTPLTVQIRDGSATAPATRSSQPRRSRIGGDERRVVRPDHLRLSRFGHRGNPVLDRGHERQRRLVLVLGTGGDPDSAYVGGKLDGSPEAPRRRAPGPEAARPTSNSRPRRAAPTSTPPTPGNWRRLG